MTGKTPLEVSDEKFSDFKNGRATKEDAITAIEESIEYLEKRIKEAGHEYKR